MARSHELALEQFQHAYAEAARRIPAIKPEQAADIAILKTPYGRARVVVDEWTRSDNGPEFVSKAILQWLADEKVGAAFIDPGKPWQNGSAMSPVCATIA
jgi:transposase InsO family protein